MQSKRAVLSSIGILTVTIVLAIMLALPVGPLGDRSSHIMRLGLSLLVIILGRTIVNQILANWCLGVTKDYLKKWFAAQGMELKTLASCPMKHSPWGGKWNDKSKVYKVAVSKNGVEKSGYVKMKGHQVFNGEQLDVKDERFSVLLAISSVFNGKQLDVEYEIELQFDKISPHQLSSS